MQPSSLVAMAAAPTIEIVSAIPSGRLGAPTPCQEYDIRALVNHLLFWGPSLEGAARKELVPPPADDESGMDPLDEDAWQKQLAAQLDHLVGAWSDPAAWKGVTRMGGPMELPATAVGGMVLCELVVHGWDLAKAAGLPIERANQPFSEQADEPARLRVDGPAARWDEVVLAETLTRVAETAELGRQMGAFGPEVSVLETAPTLDKIVALTGRDPGWRA